jgi:DNA primase
LAAAAISSHPDDAISEAPTAVREAVKAALEQLPADEELLSNTFVAIGRKLRLRRIDEQLSYIAHIAGQTQGVNDLSEETRKLQGERMDLLALRRRVLQESNPVPSGTNPQG